MATGRGKSPLGGSGKLPCHFVFEKYNSHESNFWLQGRKVTRISSGSQNWPYKHYPLAVFILFFFFFKKKPTFTWCMQPLHICLINVWLHNYFFFPSKGRELLRARGIVHSWLADGSRCSNNDINNFHFKIDTPIHTFTYNYCETHANTNTMARMWIYSAATSAHTRGLGGKIFIFGPSFATLVTALD